MIELKNVTKKFNEKKPNEKIALDNICLSIGEGEMTAIVGKSGAGKTTLLKILACLLRQSSGDYLLNGVNVKDMKEAELAELRNKSVGLITQNSYLINEISVFDNVVLPLTLVKMKKDERKKRVKEILLSVGMDKLSRQRVGTLSGGEKQRVAIARALINNPDIILADEPTGALDIENGKNIMDILLKINSLGKTMIVVTHDPDIAALCPRVITLSDGKVLSDTVLSAEYE